MEDLMTFSKNKSWPWSFVVAKIQKQMPMKKRFVVSWYPNKKKKYPWRKVCLHATCVSSVAVHSESNWQHQRHVSLWFCFCVFSVDSSTRTQPLASGKELHDRLQQQWIFCVFSSETLRLSGLLRLSDSWMWRGHECLVFFACLFCFERTFNRFLLHWHWMECFPVSVYFQIGYMNWEASPAQGWVYMGNISILGSQFI